MSVPSLAYADAGPILLPVGGHLYAQTETIRTSVRQVWFTVLANMKSRYRGSWAGVLWVVVNPLIIYGAQSFAFHYVLRLQVPNYFVFLLSGLLPWLFIVQSLEMCAGLLVNSGPLLKSYPIHPLVCLLAQVMDNFFNLVLLLFILLPAVLLSGVPFLNIVLFSIPLLACLMAVIGLSWILATMQVFWRDTRFILSFVLNVSFFLTPVFYPQNFVEPKYQWIIRLNVFHYLLLPFRDLAGASVDPHFVLHCLMAWTLGLVFCGAAALYWKEKRNVAFFYI